MTCQCVDCVRADFVKAMQDRDRKLIPHDSPERKLDVEGYIDFLFDEINRYRRSSVWSESRWGYR